MMTSFDKLTTAQKIAATLHRDVQAICTETCHLLGLEISKPAIDLVSELVYKKLCVCGTDLEAFSKHAKRSTINSDDVKLLVRRCPSLKSHLYAVSPTTAAIPKEKKRKTIAGVRQAETPKAKEPEIQTAKKRDIDVLMSAKQKEIDLFTSKQKLEITASTSKEKGEKVVAEKEDSMMLDELIDLTFD